MDEIKKSYERGFNQSYFVVESEFNDSKENFEMRMLEYNHVEGILPLEIQREENRITYKFNITSLKSLSAMLELKKLDEENLRKLVVEFHKLMYVLPEYLLNEERVMIDSDYIFMNPKDSTLHFCYMFEKKKSSREQLRELLSKLLSYINHDDHNAVVLGYQLLKVSEREEFVYSDLLDVINHFITENHTDSKVLHRVEYPKNTSEIVEDSEVAIHEIDEILLMKNDMDQKKSVEEKDVNKQRAFRFRDLFGFKQHREDKQRENEEVEIQSEEERQWIEYLNEYDEQKEVEEAEHTTLLSERLKELEAKELHILKSLNRSIKDIELSFFPFVIGKQERVCDYVISSNNISRIHLKIDCRDGRYFVQDLNSLNGTKLCGRQMETDVEEQIFENDELDIAGFKFMFV